MNWDDFENFGPNEFRCKCGCGVVEMDPAFVATLQRIRNEFGGPMPISSGYRCPKHPVEARKRKPGAHAKGLAADILVSGSRAINLLRIALSYDEVQGVGINQKGKGRFIHLDSVIDGLPRPHLWSY